MEGRRRALLSVPFGYASLHCEQGTPIPLANDLQLFNFRWQSLFKFGWQWTIAWLKDVQMKTTSGRQTLDLQIRQLEDLRRQKLEITRALRKLSHSEKFEDTLRLLMTVPGIGQTTGLALLAEIIDITRFKNSEELAAYVGMIPMCHSSGEHEGVGDITLRKHAILRSNIIEAAWVAIRKDESMQLCYLNNCKKMVPSKAIVKVARKLVNRIYFVLKRRQPYVNAVA